MDLSQFTSDDLRQLKALLDAQTDDSGRSPFRDRQLHDLRLLPTKDDPRPTFFWSAETPRDHPVGPGTPFPRLMWHVVTNQEITVKNQADMDRHSEDYTVVPPNMAPPDPQQELAELMAQLSQDDRAMLLASMQHSKLAQIQAQLGALSSAALDDVMARVPAAEAAPKRKSGRPRKVA